MTSILPSYSLSIHRREVAGVRLARAGSAWPLPLAPAKFLGVQEGFGPIAPIELWNLTSDIPGLGKAGATLSRATLIAAGYRLPASAAALKHA
jgi:hypothetical protein